MESFVPMEISPNVFIILLSGLSLLSVWQWCVPGQIYQPSSIINKDNYTNGLCCKTIFILVMSSFPYHIILNAPETIALLFK